MLEEQRQIGLDAGWQIAAADLFVNARAAGVAGEIGAVVGAKLLARSGIGGYFARRQQLYGFNLLGGALGLRIELAYGFDFIVEQVQAVGRRTAHGKQVDQRAAHRIFALGLDLGDRLVTGGDQARGEFGGFQGVAGTDAETASLQPFTRRQALQQRIGGDDQHPGLQVRQTAEHRHAVREDFLVWRKRVVGQDLRIRHVRHGQ